MSRRLKILHIISSWKSDVGNELAEFVVRLSREHYENEICVLTKSHARQIADVPVTTHNLRWQFDAATYLGISRIIRRFRPDVIHTWDHTAQRYGAIHFGKHHVIAERREDYQPTGRLQQYIDQRTYRYIVPRKICGCSKTIVIPPAAVPLPYGERLPADELLAKLDFPLVEPAGNYYPVFQPQYEPARRNYKTMIQSSQPFLVGIVLPLCSEHRILDALWAFETLNHVHLNFHALFIGDGKDREICLRYRDRWKLFSRVHFLGNRENCFRLLPHCDVLLHLSSSAAHSGTILSAMSCGVPVIALETPESREYVVDGTTGLLIPADGDFRFYRRTAAKKLLYLSENTELRRAMQTASKERVEKHFNFDRVVQQRMQVYGNMTQSVCCNPDAIHYNGTHEGIH
jgi:glycosyltransferase involved in cell wall biosynthesis